MPRTEDKLITSVSGFREALLSCLRSGKLPQTMENFPRGCCSDSALMLGTYLSDSGLGDFILVMGERGCFDDNNWSSHAWLQQENLIVDITGAQFGDESNDITITSDSVWYDSFIITEFYPANIKEIACELRPYYKIVLRHIE